MKINHWVNEAGHEQTPSTRLTTLYNLFDSKNYDKEQRRFVYQTLAKNPSTPKHTLEWLADDGFFDLVRKNPVYPLLLLEGSPCLMYYQRADDLLAALLALPWKEVAAFDCWSETASFAYYSQKNTPHDYQPRKAKEALENMIIAASVRGIHDRRNEAERYQKWGERAQNLEAIEQAVGRLRKATHRPR